MNNLLKVFLLLLICTSFRLHDFHTSIARIDFNAKEKTLEVSIRVFTDDLESALSKDNGGQKFVVVNNDKNDAFVEKYIRKHFAFISSKKQKKSFAYIGKEQEADATWIYVEVPMNEPFVGFSLQNDILHELFDDQINLVNISYPQKKSYIFKKGEGVVGL